MPTLSASAAVMGRVLARPRMPSVPKYFRDLVNVESPLNWFVSHHTGNDRLCSNGVHAEKGLKGRTFHRLTLRQAAKSDATAPWRVAFIGSLGLNCDAGH